MMHIFNTYLPLQITYFYCYVSKSFSNFRHKLNLNVYTNMFDNFLYAKILPFILIEVATCCNVSQRVATHCNALQHVATVTKVTEPIASHTSSTTTIIIVIISYRRGDNQFKINFCVVQLQ